LRKKGKEICTNCWNKITWDNFVHTPYTKPVGEACPVCENSNNYNTQNGTNENGESQRKKDDEWYKDRVDRIEKDFNDIYNTCASCQNHVHGTSYYIESEPTKHYCINCKLDKEKDGE